MGILPDVAASLAVSEPKAGMLVSAYALGVVTGAPVLAVLGARMGRRALLLALLGLFTVAHVGATVAPSFPVLVGARFVGGLPHGAYLGVAALVASSLVAEERRGRAIASVLLGLTVANIAGVPVSTAIGQHWGWRAAFLMVAVLGLVTLLAVRLAVPHVPADRSNSMSGELRGLRHPQLWLTVAIGVVGFGGMFAVYTYISSTLTEVSGLSRGWVPVVLALFGVGMTVGTVIGGRLADRSVLGTITIGLAAIAIVMAGFTVAVRSPVTAVIGVFAIGLVCMTVMPSMQARLIDVAPDAPTLAASLNHSALNAANAAGAWAGGLVLSAGASYAAIGWVGAALAVTGAALAAVSVALNRHRPPPPHR